MINQKQKDNHLKFRVSDELKSTVEKTAKELNMNTSEYIRYCISLDYPSMVKRIPDSIATSNLLNKIYHCLEGQIDPKLLTDIKGFINDYYDR